MLTSSLSSLDRLASPYKKALLKTLPWLGCGRSGLFSGWEREDVKTLSSQRHFHIEVTGVSRRLWVKICWTMGQAIFCISLKIASLLTSISRWWFQTCFMFTPIIWGGFPFWRSFFFGMGLVIHGLASAKIHGKSISLAPSKWCVASCFPEALRKCRRILNESDGSFKPFRRKKLGQNP